MPFLCIHECTNLGKEVIISVIREENEQMFREEAYMCTQSQLNIVLKKISEIYKSVYGEKLVRVILYGSYARGDFSDDSDLDIVALVHGDRMKLQEQLKNVWDQTCDLELEYEMVLSPAVIPYEEFEKYREDLPYYRNIANEGVNVVA